MKLDKVTLFASGIGLAGWSLADFVIHRTNRLVAGEGLSIWQTSPYLYGMIILLFWGALFILSFLSLAYKKEVSAAVVVILILSIILTAGVAAQNIITAENPYARISLGAGFWLMLFAAIIPLIGFLSSGGRSRIAKTAIILAAGAGITTLFVTGQLGQLSIVQEFANREEKFVSELFRHIKLAFASVGISAGVGVPMAILLFRKTSLQNISFTVLNLFQTIPSIALFGILIAPLAFLSAKYNWLQTLGIQGIGWAPAVIALTIYALLPIVRNTFTGLVTVDDDIVEAAVGMGMTDRQVLWRIQFPLSLSVILSGIRIAVIQSIGLTTVAALIGAGGFGVFIFQGLGQAAEDLVLLGAIPTILLAIVTDFMMQGMIVYSKRRGREA